MATETLLTRADLEAVLAKIPRAIGDELAPEKRPVNVRKVDALDDLRRVIRDVLPYLEAS